MIWDSADFTCSHAYHLCLTFRTILSNLKMHFINKNYSIKCPVMFYTSLSYTYIEVVYDPR